MKDNVILKCINFRVVRRTWKGNYLILLELPKSLIQLKFLEFALLINNQASKVVESKRDQQG